VGPNVGLVVEADPEAFRVEERGCCNRSFGGRNCGRAAPPVGAEGIDVLVLGKMDGSDEGLGKIGEGTGGAGLNVAEDDGGQEAAESGGEIAGGEVLTGEEIGEFASEFIGGAGLGVFAGVVGAEVGMVAEARGAAAAAIGEGETTQGLAVLWAKRGHRCLQKLS
jgi:hypothetical protein